jgi:hypothetical protein
VSTSNTGNKTHDDAVRAAEGARQAGVSSTSQATTTSADIVFYRAARASAIANGLSPSCFGDALRNLGTGGI